MLKYEALVKSLKMTSPVIPAKANQRRSLAGIQEQQALLDPGFRRGDGFDDFLRGRQNMIILLQENESLRACN
jgi:hypothetical protein